MKKLIEDIYSVFSKYTTSNMHYCQCGCIDEEDVKKLASKPLKELEENDFSSYHGSALYTWGEIEHYKHFLPRILEVHHQLKGKSIIGVYEIGTKLEYAKWSTWNENEITIITEFMKLDWNSLVNKRKSDISTMDFEEYSFFIKPKELINNWKIMNNKIAFRNFIYFFYSNGTEILNKGIKINGKYYQNEFLEIINNRKITEKLENEFFIIEETNKNYSEKISIVLQMIEQNNGRQQSV